VAIPGLPEGAGIQGNRTNLEILETAVLKGHGFNRAVQQVRSTIGLYRLRKNPPSFSE
jgi:hypothetical protein